MQYSSNIQKYPALHSHNLNNHKILLAYEHIVSIRHNGPGIMGMPCPRWSKSANISILLRPCPQIFFYHSITLQIISKLSNKRTWSYLLRQMPWTELSTHLLIYGDNNSLKLVTWHNMSWDQNVTWPISNICIDKSFSWKAAFEITICRPHSDWGSPLMVRKLPTFAFVM